MYSLPRDKDIIKRLLEIRTFENKLLDLFSKGYINGTTHTCIGQEHPAIVMSELFCEGDFVLSNHRGHGHYLALTKDFHGLLAEITGRIGGVNNGVGGSQHLKTSSFLTTGIQGENIAVGAGIAMDYKLKNKKNIVFSHIGDGTWGQGNVYETLNMCSLWNLPLIIICENNGISQTTLSKHNMAGNIESRAKAFDINYIQINTYQTVQEVLDILIPRIEEIRETPKPLIIEYNCDRLGPHSKGDDTRDPKIIESLHKKDLLIQTQKCYPKEFEIIDKEVQDFIDLIVSEVLDKDLIETESIKSSKGIYNYSKTSSLNKEQTNISILQNLNSGIEQTLKSNNTLVIGEDIHDPYGGAFKVTKGLQEKFPSKIISTPISELGLTGLANGLSINGNNCIVEYMFADFSLLAIDQIINFACKSVSMYGKRIKLPIIYRCPYGGYRGYGPTHSQTVYKFFIGTPNLILFEISPLHDATIYLEEIFKLEVPSILFESKTIYPKKIINDEFDIFKVRRLNNFIGKISIEEISDNVIICAGGQLQNCIDTVKESYIEYETNIHILNPLQLYPIQDDLIRHIREGCYKSVYIIDESTPGGSWSTELKIKLLNELGLSSKIINSNDEIIPSSKHLETKMLINSEKILNNLNHE